MYGNAEHGPEHPGGHHADPEPGIRARADSDRDRGEIGAGRARIVTGAAHRLDLERLLTGSTHGLELSDGEVPAGGESMALLSELADALASEPVLFHPGDGLFGGQIAAMCERFMGGDVAAVISADAARGDGADASKWRVSDQP